MEAHFYRRYHGWIWSQALDNPLSPSISGRVFIHVLHDNESNKTTISAVGGTGTIPPHWMFVHNTVV